jgi:hypothetical protein
MLPLSHGSHTTCISVHGGAPAGVAD